MADREKNIKTNGGKSCLMTLDFDKFSNTGKVISDFQAVS